jgi:hypothetical protein
MQVKRKPGGAPVLATLRRSDNAIRSNKFGGFFPLSEIAIRLDRLQFRRSVCLK